MTLWSPIGHLTGLQVLDLGENLIGDRALKQFGPYLARLLCLHTLNLSEQGEMDTISDAEDVSELTMAGALALVPTLCNLPCLKVLDLSNNYLMRAAYEADPNGDLEDYDLELIRRLPSVDVDIF